MREQEIKYSDFFRWALEAGFTAEQAEFMYNFLQVRKK